jgi:uncharacterized protein (TIGR02302 family)
VENLEDQGRPAEALIARLSRRARLTLAIERGWSAFIASLVVTGLFVAVSWLGLWTLTPDWARIAGIIIFAAGLLWAIRLAFLVRAPTQNEALDRIDRDSGFSHRPAAALADSLAGSSRDSFTNSLWLAHRRAAEAAAGSFKVRPPSVQIALHDRFAVRAGVLVALIAAGFIAGPEKHSRLLSAFLFSPITVSGPDSRIDAWIDPPAYTGRPPVVLKMAIEQIQTIQAPTASQLVVRTFQSANITIETSGQIGAKVEAAEVVGASKAPEASRAPSNERRFLISGDSKLTIRQNGSVLSTFQFVAIPDNAPAIALLDLPKSNGRGALTLSYRVVDDYGIVGAEAEFSNPRVRNLAPASRPLVEAPKLPLGLPAGLGNSGDAETSADLSEHAWAGARVSMVLTAHDEAGQVGRSESAEIILPQRPFVKPLARALVEQRLNLALAPKAKSQVAIALDALMIEPNRFSTSAGQYLGLRSIAARMAGAKNDDDLRSVLDLMWEMALLIEEGDLSSAERDLKAAQQELREALEIGASDEEIARLMNQLRAAMDRFLQEFADKQSREQDQADQGDRQNPGERSVSSQDLNRMLDQMEEMARSGNSADAQNMLNDLQKMLENLKSARRGADRQTREMNRSLNQLDQMMRDQQELRDRTFQQNRLQSQQGRRDGENPEENPGRSDNDQNLRENQEALRKRLEDVQRRMRQFGMKPEQGLDDAESAMREAEGALGEGETNQGRAVDAQGRALEGLRRGAQSMAEQMQPGGEPGQEKGQEAGQGSGPGAHPGRNSASTDPLGRESRNRGDQSRSVYDPLGAPSAQRAQQVLEELRKRLSDPARPRDELDYLERLLRRY